MRQATLCFLLRERDGGPEVLLALKKQGFGQGKWNGIGGKVDAGERVQEAARREVAEEIGVEVGPLEKVALLTFCFMHFVPALRQTGISQLNVYSLNMSFLINLQTDVSNHYLLDIVDKVDFYI